MQASEASEQYQLAKMRCLRDINADSNTVGWYQSAPYNDFQNIAIIDTFISYDESVKKCVCIVCDTREAARGALALRAIGLSRKFLTLYKKNPNVCPALLRLCLGPGLPLEVSFCSCTSTRWPRDTLGTPLLCHGTPDALTSSRQAHSTRPEAATIGAGVTQPHARARRAADGEGLF